MFRKPEHQPDDEAVAQAHQGEAQCEQHALQEGDDELAAEEGHHDVHELAHQVHDVGPGLALQEREVALDVEHPAGVGDQEEGEVDRQDGPGEHRPDAGKQAGAGGEGSPAYRLQPLHQGLLAAFRRARELAQDRVLAHELDRLRRSLPDPLHRGLPPVRDARDEVADLIGDEGAEEPQEGGEGDQDRQDDGYQGKDPAQVQADPQPLEVGLEHERRHRRHHQGQEDRGEAVEEAAEQPEDEADRTHDDRRREDRDRGGDRVLLSSGQLQRHRLTSSGLRAW